MRRSVKLKLGLTPEEKQALDDTAEEFKQACQEVVEYGWNDDALKTYNKKNYTTGHTTPYAKKQIYLQTS